MFQNICTLSDASYPSPHTFSIPDAIKLILSIGLDVRRIGISPMRNCTLMEYEGVGLWNVSGEIVACGRGDRVCNWRVETGRMEDDEWRMALFLEGGWERRFVQFSRDCIGWRERGRKRLGIADEGGNDGIIEESEIALMWVVPSVES